MAVRKTFKADERTAFTVGAEVQWQHGSRWVDGVVNGEIVKESDGWQYLPVRSTGKSPTVPVGEQIQAGAGRTRLRPAPAAG